MRLWTWCHREWLFATFVRLLTPFDVYYGCDVTVNGLYWEERALSVKRAVAMVLLMKLDCEWIVLDGVGALCEVCSRHGVIDAARMRFAILLSARHLQDTCLFS